MNQERKKRIIMINHTLWLQKPVPVQFIQMWIHVKLNVLCIQFPQECCLKIPLLRRDKTPKSLIRNAFVPSFCSCHYREERANVGEIYERIYIVLSEKYASKFWRKHLFFCAS